MEENELYTKLTQLQQIETVDEYFNKIQVLATRIDDVSHERLLQIAISWLKPNIQNQIKVLSPKNVEKVCEKAKVIEAQHMYRKQTPYSQLEKSSSTYIPPHQRISSSDAKRDKNLCFKCKAPNWTLGHKCKGTKLFLCEKHNNDESDNEEEVGDIPSDMDSDSDESSIQKSNDTPTLSVATMTGISQPRTLKVHGYAKKTKMAILIDSGSSHNFIDTRIDKQLNIFIYPTSKFQVSILGNKTTSCDGKCHKVELSISN